MTETELTLVESAGRFPKVDLVEPNSFGYLLATALVDRRPPLGYGFESRTKRRLLDAVHSAVAELKALPGVREVVRLKALLRPPGRSAFLRRRPAVHHARYDVAVWVETDDPDAATQLRTSPAWRQIETLLQQASTDVQVITGHNARRMGDVDHTRNGVFLLNFFYADSAAVNLAVWEYTAGWFQDQTGLRNSTLLRPDSATDYTVINHCRWDRLRDILPSLIFKPSFRRYVLAHFEANNTGAMPMLYHLA
ncbi:hypothetical protein [Mycobacterium spongiae]|uniref:Uncharacterized protein n=1 Tax=Mycobacterium spongiae TaxID=886343 RepID=A0A975JX79_9MYCO|nr:hypothetical protein [Mycobacterium spongiae]QUR67365.1 hypothetical protein F6B93_09890 [Mycobacterium spongiae]